MPDRNPLGLRAHHATASVVDIDRAVAWYRDMLGFTLIDRGSRDAGKFKFAELGIPGFGVGLVQLPAAPGARADPKAPQGATGVGAYWVHIVFTVPDPDGTFALLRRRGAQVSVRDGRVTPPLSAFLVKDSEGNEIEIIRDPAG